MKRFEFDAVIQKHERLDAVFVRPGPWRNGPAIFAGMGVH